MLNKRTLIIFNDITIFMENKLSVMNISKSALAAHPFSRSSTHSVLCLMTTDGVEQEYDSFWIPPESVTTILEDEIKDKLSNLLSEISDLEKILSNLERNQDESN